MAGDDQRLVFIGFEELVGVGDGPHMRGVSDVTFSQVGVGGLQALADSFKANTVAVDEIRIHAHANGGTRATPSKNLADAFDLRELLRQYGIGRVVKLRLRNVGRSERK